MLFTCRPEGLPIPGRFPGPMHARGKWFTIDIHCHLLTPQAEDMVAAAGLSMDWQPRHQFANEHTREVNREQARRTRVQFTSIDKRLADMDLMGIDIQAITPSPAQTYYSAEPDLGIATARIINDNLAEQTRKVLATLTPREEKVLRMRFGIGEKSDHTLEEVGQDFEVTRERIRQIEAKALRKLRHPSRSKRLRAFVES